LPTVRCQLRSSFRQTGNNTGSAGANGQALLAGSPEKFETTKGLGCELLKSVDQEKMARPKATILELFSEFVSAVPQVGLSAHCSQVWF
jgi:hypothetical protein